MRGWSKKSEMIYILVKLCSMFSFPFPKKKQKKCTMLIYLCVHISLNLFYQHWKYTQTTIIWICLLSCKVLVLQPMLLQGLEFKRHKGSFRMEDPISICKILMGSFGINECFPTIPFKFSWMGPFCIRSRSLYLIPTIFRKKNSPSVYLSIHFNIICI